MHITSIDSPFIILVTLIVLVTIYIEMPREQIVQGNGCGSAFNMCGVVEVVDEDVIILCCNIYNYCYNTCASAETECD